MCLLEDSPSCKVSWLMLSIVVIQIRLGLLKSDCDSLISFLFQPCSYFLFVISLEGAFMWLYILWNHCINKALPQRRYNKFYANPKIVMVSGPHEIRVLTFRDLLVIIVRIYCQVRFHILSSRVPIWFESLPSSQMPLKIAFYFLFSTSLLYSCNVVNHPYSFQLYQWILNKSRKLSQPNSH